MQFNHELIIVIPCFNEENRLQVAIFEKYLSLDLSRFICFVNDGSSDNTKEVLESIEQKFPNQVEVLNLKENRGKAFAVRAGILLCLKCFEFRNIAYLDADLSTSLEECYEIHQRLNENYSFAFGSRIAKLDTTIDRKFYRFFIGRIIATLISLQLKVKVYDTQCGCKVFSKEIAGNIFHEKFISKWLFDVEIFHRLIHSFGQEEVKNNCLEIPLKNWIDTDDSKVKFSYFFKLWFDLLRIKNKYKTTGRTNKKALENALS
ncbi:glycosyltransferase [Aureivirga marina]|uniref:glycosyltransferase n=1 Tax=Aureivirga marina TaxID=1182451 RepID=UPI0018CBBBAC|nr:glycosyltransferase [Aureivirga marina]